MEASDETLSSCSCMAHSCGVVVAVLMMGGLTLGVLRRIEGDVLSHLMQKFLRRVVHNVRTSGAEIPDFSYHSLACEYVGR